MDELNLKSKAIEVDIDLGKTTVTAATAALQQASLDRRQGLQSLGSIVGEEKEILNKEVENKLAADTANARTNLGKLQLMSQVAQRIADRESRDANKLTDQIIKLNQGISKTYSDLLEKDQSFQMLLIEHAANMRSGNPEDIAKTQPAINAMREKLYAQAQKIATDSGVITTRANLEARLNDIIGVNLGASGITAEQIAAIKQK